MIGQILWPLAFVVGMWLLSDAIRQFSPVAIGKANQPDALPELPEDLMALALNETESWAQEEQIQVMRQRFEDYGDWNRVRVAMGVARTGP